MGFTSTTAGLLRAQRRAHQQWRTLAAQGERHHAENHAPAPEDSAITEAWTVAHRIGQKALAALEAEEAEQAAALQTTD